MVGKSVMFSNVIVDIAFPCCLVFGQSCCEVSDNLSDVGGMAVEQLDLIDSSLSVPWFISNLRSAMNSLWAMQILKGCRMQEMFTDMLFMYGIVALVVGVVVLLVVVGPLSNDVFIVVVL